MSDIPFLPGDWIIDRNNPGQPGQYTGKWRTAGPHYIIQLAYPDGSTSYRPLVNLEQRTSNSLNTIEESIRKRHFGNVRDLQRLLTYEKLKGSLHAIIYSMEAAQIDFYPYQFKPVIKFINSPTERLIIADEVGLGKTIESALIWIELQARRQAKRLLIVCPKMLGEKWRDELRRRFVLDARVVDFNDLKLEIDELKKAGPSHSFNLIATYSGLRPPKSEINLLSDAPGTATTGSPKTEFLREIYNWSLSFDPFDLVIFDEAHYMRNSATTTFHLGECLAESAGAVLCVSATPVNNSNTDLHSLLRLTDKDFFETQGLFDILLEANRPTVQALNALSRNPVDFSLLKSAIGGMSNSQFIKESPMFKLFLEKLESFDPANKAQLAKLQDITERLNLLGGYINRTRRVQVKENRPLRQPVVLSLVFSPEEMMLYNTILKIVRKKCRMNSKPFHIFQVMGLQLRAASCLPAIADELRNRILEDADDLLSEALGEEVWDDIEDSDFEDQPDENELNSLLKYDFEKNDSKYKILKNYILKSLPQDKLIVFAYYRNTLNYLFRRMTADGFKATVIHGGMKNDRRLEEISRFQDPRGPQILLSSEVGSEGLDLQFSHIIVNYDLPWNPMRVEQRIGRIDRVGQLSKRLSIINFKVSGTVEERLYDRLHSKLLLFENSLGDLEAIIGKEVQNLTVNLLSKDLTPEEEQLIIEQTERAIENQLVQIQTLEESGDTLIALSDYVQKKIEEDRNKGRYIQPYELEDYLSDFFEREFRGCEINYDKPAQGCLKIRLTPEAQFQLSEYIKDDRSMQARPLRQREFNITFRRNVMQQLSSSHKHSVHFANNISPLIRWITKVNQERAHNFYKVSALAVNHSALPPGDYCYKIEKWRFNGLGSKEVLAYGIRSLLTHKVYSNDEAEEAIQDLMRNGADWHNVDCDMDLAINEIKVLEETLISRFDNLFMEFDMENKTNYQIKLQRVVSFFDRRIEQHKRRIQTMSDPSRDPKTIRLAEGLLRSAENNKEIRISNLNEKVNLDFESTDVAAGIFRVYN